MGLSGRTVPRALGRLILREWGTEPTHRGSVSCWVSSQAGSLLFLLARHSIPLKLGTVALRGRGPVRAASVGLGGRTQGWRAAPSFRRLPRCCAGQDRGRLRVGVTGDNVHVIILPPREASLQTLAIAFGIKKWGLARGLGQSRPFAALDLPAGSILETGVQGRRSLCGGKPTAPFRPRKTEPPFYVLNTSLETESKAAS